MSPENIERALRNILATLQVEPRRYRCFGVYWWPVKALLRRRFGVDQLYMLGRYEDPHTAAMVPELGLVDMLTEALVEYAQNYTLRGCDGYVEAPDGEHVTIFDEDAGV